MEYIRSWERSHIHRQGMFEDDFPVPKVGYVSSLEGKYDKDDFSQNSFVCCCAESLFF